MSSPKIHVQSNAEIRSFCQPAPNHHTPATAATTAASSARTCKSEPKLSPATAAQKKLPLSRSCVTASRPSSERTSDSGCGIKLAERNNSQGEHDSKKAVPSATSWL